MSDDVLEKLVDISRYNAMASTKSMNVTASDVTSSFVPLCTQSFQKYQCPSLVMKIDPKFMFSNVDIFVDNR